MISDYQMIVQSQELSIVREHLVGGARELKKASGGKQNSKTRGSSLQPHAQQWARVSVENAS